MKLSSIHALLMTIVMLGTATHAEELSAERYNVDNDWLEKLYSDKTWEWENGHAYFAPDGTFQAAIGSNQSGVGTWYSAGKGKICFRAKWTSPDGPGPIKKCWKHAGDDQKRLWQAPLDGGFRLKWELFNNEEQLKPGNVYKSKFDYASADKSKIDGRPLRNDELIKLYYGKTWKWEDGHAFFANRGELRAVSGTNSIGEGIWYPKKKGRLCIDATWAGADFDSVKNKRCWLHLVDDAGNIWQAASEDPTGWVLFEPEKEFLKGDRYGKQFTKLKGRLGQ